MILFKKLGCIVFIPIYGVTQYQILAFYFDILINSSACFNVNSVISDPDYILAISLIFCFSSNSFNEVSVLPSLTDFEI